MTSSAAQITGKVTSQEGNIGGFTISSGSLNSSDGVFGLSSTQASMSIGPTIKIKADGSNSYIAGGTQAQGFGAFADGFTGFLLGMRGNSDALFEVNDGDDNFVIFDSNNDHSLVMSTNCFRVNSDGNGNSSNPGEVFISGSATDTGSFGRMEFITGSVSHIEFKNKSNAPNYQISRLGSMKIGDVGGGGQDGPVELHAFGSKVLEVLDGQVDITGTLDVSSAIQAGTGTENAPAFQFASSNDGFYHLDSGDAGINVLVNNVQEFLFADGGGFHADADITAFSSTVSSDKRLKTNIQSISGSLYKLKQLRPVEFDWLVDRDRHEYGLLAQEVEKVVPEIVVENRAIGDTKKFLKDLDGTETFKTVDYSKLNVLLIDAVKEQQKQIDELKKEVEELKNGSN